eukprot:11340950-Ditylum_brightwellii.AAC.1
MEKTQILVDSKFVCDATDNPSIVQPSIAPGSPSIPPVHIQPLSIVDAGLNSQVPCSAVLLLHIHTVWHENMSMNTVLLQATKNMSNEKMKNMILTWGGITVKGKNKFSIKDVYEEEIEELHCDSDIDGKEIDDLHEMAHIVKDAKAMLKEEDDAVADDPWENG